MFINVLICDLKQISINYRSKPTLSRGHLISSLYTFYLFLLLSRIFFFSIHILNVKRNTTWNKNKRNKKKKMYRFIIMCINIVKRHFALCKRVFMTCCSQQLSSTLISPHIVGNQPSMLSSSRCIRMKNDRCCVSSFHQHFAQPFITKPQITIKIL